MLRQTLNDRQRRQAWIVVFVLVGLLPITAVTVAAYRSFGVVPAASTGPQPASSTASAIATTVPTAALVRAVPSTGRAVPTTTISQGQAIPTTSMYRPPRPGITFTVSSTRVREGQTISVAGTGCVADHVTTTVPADVTSTLQARVVVVGFALGGEQVYPVDERGNWHGSFRIPQRSRPRPANAVGDFIGAQCERSGPDGELVEAVIGYDSRDLTVISG